MKKTLTTSDIEPKAHMHAGLICSEQSYTLVMSKSARQRFGFNVDDYLYISSIERDTCICRRLKDFPVRMKTASDYVYMDRHSLGLLDVDTHACLNVWRADVTLEIP